MMKFTGILAVCASLTGVALATQGRATFFTPVAGLGSCGVHSVATDLIVALSPQQMNGGATCLKKIKVNYQGHSVQAKVVETCAACGVNDIDLSPSAFQALAPLDVGLIQVEWDFV